MHGLALNKILFLEHTLVFRAVYTVQLRFLLR